MYCNTFLLLGFVLLGITMIKAEGLNRKNYANARSSSASVIKNNSNGAKPVIQDVSQVANAKITSEGKSSFSLIEKVREIFVRILAEIDELLENNRDNGVSSNVSKSVTGSSSLHHQNKSSNNRLMTTTSVNKVSVARNIRTSTASSSLTTKPPKKRLCREMNGKKECQCGPNKKVYDVVKFKCIDNQLISRDTTKGAAALVPVIATLAEPILKLIHEQWDHLGDSHATYLELINDSDGPLSIEVSDVDNGDWDGDSRPDHQFQQAVIEPRSNLNHRQEINAKRSSAMSTMKFSQNGQEAFSIRIDQWAAKSKDEEKQDFNLQNGWKAHLTGGIGGDTLQYRFEKP